MTVAIIGAGPIGLELAVAFKRASIDYVRFDAAQIGATMQWYPFEMVNVPGVFVAGTAIAGSPQERVRIIVEDCHVHVPRIVAAVLRRHGRA
jgi:thioredoxin reductase (NADPH)